MFNALTAMGMGDNSKMEAIIEQEASEFCSIMEQRIGDRAMATVTVLKRFFNVKYKLHFVNTSTNCLFAWPTTWCGG